MPNIRSEETTADFIHIVASDGREVTISRAKIEQEFGGKLGTTDERKRSTADVIKAMIVAALGEEQIGAEDIDFDFDHTDAKKPMAMAVKDASARVVKADAGVKVVSDGNR